MPTHDWGDFQPGAISMYGPQLVTREEIIAFAAKIDPLPMQLDEFAVGATMLGGLGASGWYAAVVWMRLIVDFHRGLTESAQARGASQLAGIGPALGFRGLR